MLISFTHFNISQTCLFPRLSRDSQDLPSDCQTYTFEAITGPREDHSRDEKLSGLYWGLTFEMELVNMATTEGRRFSGVYPCLIL